MKRNKLVWACVGYTPTYWGFGSLTKDGSMKNIKAFVSREKSGLWEWSIAFSYEYGREPSKDEAMKAAEIAYEKIVNRETGGESVNGK